MLAKEDETTAAELGTPVQAAPVPEPKLDLDDSDKRSRKVRKGSKSERAQFLATLSPREREVFTLLIEGHTLRESAAILGLSYPTVNTHQTKLYKKLGVSSRAELIILYRDLVGKA